MVTRNIVTSTYGGVKIQVWLMTTDIHLTTGAYSELRLIADENVVHNCESVHELFLHSRRHFGSHSQLYSSATWSDVMDSLTLNLIKTSTLKQAILMHMSTLDGVSPGDNKNSMVFHQNTSFLKSTADSLATQNQSYCSMLPFLNRKTFSMQG